MGMGKLLFNKGCHIRDLEKTMVMAKKNFPALQIIFVIINKKGDAILAGRPSSVDNTVTANWWSTLLKKAITEYAL